MAITTDAKQALKETVRSLRARLLADLHDATTSDSSGTSSSGRVSPRRPGRPRHGRTPGRHERAVGKTPPRADGPAGRRGGGGGHRDRKTSGANQRGACDPLRGQDWSRRRHPEKASPEAADPLSGPERRPAHILLTPRGVRSPPLLSRGWTGRPMTGRPNRDGCTFQPKYTGDRSGWFARPGRRACHSRGRACCRRIRRTTAGSTPYD